MSAAASPAHAPPLAYGAVLQAAAGLHGAGDFDEAERLYQQLLGFPEAQVEVLHYVLGVLNEQRGDPSSALRHYDQSLAAGFISPDLFEQRAQLLGAQGRWAEAVDSYDRLLALRPGLAAAAVQRGVALAALGRLQEAVDSYDRALALDPYSARTLNNKGVALEAMDRLEAALQAYEQASALDEAYSIAHHNRGSVLIKLERPDAAIASLERALALAPDTAETLNLLGTTLIGKALYARAEACLAHAIALRPAFAEAWSNRAAALRALDRWDEAYACADHALRLAPGLADAWVNRGSALARLNRYDEAIADYDTALRLNPALTTAIANRGLARQALGDADGALADLEEAYRRAPHTPDNPFNVGLAYLRRGDLARGFGLYQDRWNKPGGPRLPHPRATQWTGEQDIAARTVLIWAEQGFGDVIQFCRFTRDVADRGARVILQVQPPLRRLMAALDGPAEIIGLDEPAPAFDLQLPVMDLPLALGLSLDDLPGRVGYLKPPADVAALWSARLPDSPTLRVGVAWSGNPGHDNDRNRSMPLEALGSILDGRAQFISLQKDHRAGDLIQMAQLGLPAFSDDLKDFADTAGLIERCDLVAAVDTSIAHLAGALGKPVLLMTPRLADWRWMDRRPDSPWYPSLRILRQTDFGDWRAPVCAAGEIIAAWSKTGPA